MRSLPHNTLVLATHNKGKLAEIKALLQGFPYIIHTAADYNMPEPIEDAGTFEGNARIKAVFVAKATGKVSLADDSGLVIPALGGAPGVDSALWAGEPRDFTKAMARVERELNGQNNVPAYFVTVLALAWPDGDVTFFRGECHGHVAFPPRGVQGHGYDAIFIREGDTRTFGELTEVEKNAISHRAQAFEPFLAFMRHG
jgi:XTP/dITP diphosphohydrolase